MQVVGHVGRKPKKVAALLAFVTAGLVTYASSAQLNWWAEPSAGTLELTTGFTPDPLVRRFRVVKTTAVSQLGVTDPTGGTCAGFVTAEQPSVRLLLSAGESLPLRLFVESAIDTTLCVNLPDSTWRCSDDDVGFHPVLDIPAGKVQSGQYDIWVGTFDKVSEAKVALYVTERTDLYPRY